MRKPEISKVISVIDTPGDGWKYLHDTKKYPRLLEADEGDLAIIVLGFVKSKAAFDEGLRGKVIQMRMSDSTNYAFLYVELKGRVKGTMVECLSTDVPFDPNIPFQIALKPCPVNGYREMVDIFIPKNLKSSQGDVYDINPLPI